MKPTDLVILLLPPPPWKHACIGKSRAAGDLRPLM
jgi:hypothetical protein